MNEGVRVRDPVGKKIGRFEVEECLGAGAMGEVYLARDPQLHRQVAIKRLASEVSADPELRAALLREARNAARITNQRVASRTSSPSDLIAAAVAAAVLISLYPVSGWPSAARARSIAGWP